MHQNIKNRQKPLFYYSFPFIFSIYIFLYYVNKYFTYTLSIVFVVSFFMIFCFNLFSFCKRPTCPMLLGIIFVLLILFSFLYASFPSTTIKTGVNTLAALIPGLYCYFYSDKISYTVFFNFFIKFAFFFSAITIISIVVPFIYTEFIIKLLPVDLQTKALHFYTPLVSAGITDQTGINAWFSVIGLSVSFAFYCTERKLKYLLLIFLFLISIVFTAKRAHLLFSILSMFIVYLSLYKRNIKKKLALLFISSLLLLIFIMLFPDVFHYMKERFTVSDDKDISSNRFLLWGIAFVFFLQKPIFGWGFGYCSNVMGTNVHNVYIQVLSELGIVGLCFFLVFLLSSIVSIFRKFKKKYFFMDNEEKLQLVFSLFIQLFFIMYCMTGNPLNDLNIFGVYFFAVCMVQDTRLRGNGCLYLK